MGDTKTGSDQGAQLLDSSVTPRRGVGVGRLCQLQRRKRQDTGSSDGGLTKPLLLQAASHEKPARVPHIVSLAMSPGCSISTADNVITSHPAYAVHSLLLHDQTEGTCDQTPLVLPGPGGIENKGLARAHTSFTNAP